MVAKKSSEMSKGFSRFWVLVMTLAPLGCKPLKTSGNYQLRNDINSKLTKDETKPAYSTRTPYPSKDIGNPEAYEKAPSGFAPVFAELVSRHGARGLSEREHDAILYNALVAAQKKMQLTVLGVSLLKDLGELISINSCLGTDSNAPQVKPGYGNLSTLGIREQTELGARFYTRLEPYFKPLLSQMNSVGSRPILVTSSGVDRAKDSAYFFKKGFTKASQNTASSLFKETKGVGPQAEDGVNRYLLYFHKLKKDESPSEKIYKDVYKHSLAYQDYRTSSYQPKATTKLMTVEEKLTAIRKKQDLAKMARKVLSLIFVEDFLVLLEAGNKTLSFDNLLTDFEAKDKLNKPCPVVEPGETKVSKSMEDLAWNLYGVVSIAPALIEELNGLSYEKYLAKDAGKLFEYLSDLEEFYTKGPGMTEYQGVTTMLAQGLVQDFFDQIDQVESALKKNESAPAAVLRFSHAEVIIPFAAQLGIKKASKALDLAQDYSYETSEWRGAQVSPFSANIQWDVFRNQSGQLLVKMLYNEKEIEFKAECSKAKYKNSQYFYDFMQLKACYAAAGMNSGNSTAASSSSPSMPVPNGESLYKKTCLDCHGEKGSTGAPTENFEALKEALKSKSAHRTIQLTDEELKAISLYLGSA